MNQKPSGKAIVIACILNLVVPVPRIASGFPRLFHMEPERLGGRIVGNTAFIFAFLATFLPLYIICFIVSMITNPIAMKLAMGTQ